LISAGMIASNREIRGRQIALKYLSERPELEAQLSLALARLLRPDQAFPLYRKARALVEEVDQPRLQLAYMKWAKELIQRGFPKQAAEELNDAPRTPELDLLRARAFERAGMFKESLEVLQLLPENPEHLALKASLYYRLGRVIEAKEYAQKALVGGIEARAEAQNTLGLISYSNGDFQAAIAAYRKSAALWLGLGDQNRRLTVLGNIAIARSRMGQDVQNVFQEVFEASKDNLDVQAQTFINLGWEYQIAGKNPEALKSYQQAEQTAEMSGNVRYSAIAQQNAGTLLHVEGDLLNAKSYYLKAIHSARAAGEVHVLAVTMANLAEAENDIDAWEEAIAIMENAGYHNEAALHREDLRVFINQII
jgi:tetratricopeptide (TPR) repeat protein